MGPDTSPQLPRPSFPSPPRVPLPTTPPAPAVQPPAFIARPSGPFPESHGGSAAPGEQVESVRQTRFVKKQLASLFFLVLSGGSLVLGALNPEAMDEQDDPAWMLAVGAFLAVIALLSLRGVVDRSTTVVTGSPGVVTIEFRRRFTGSTVRTVTVENLKSIVLVTLRQAGFKIGKGYEIKTRRRWFKTRVDPTVFSVSDQAKLKRILNTLLAEQQGLASTNMIRTASARVVPHG